MSLCVNATTSPARRATRARIDNSPYLATPLASDPHRSRRRDHRRNIRDRAREEYNTDTNSSSGVVPQRRPRGDVLCVPVPRERPRRVLRLSIPMRTKRARLLPIPRGIHHPRQRVVRALQSVPERPARENPAKSRASVVHASSLVSIHVGSHPASRSATARAANRFPRARSSEVDAHASRTTYPSRRMRSRESLESAAATSSSRDGATRPPSRTPSASSNRRHASRSATVSGERGGANAGVTSRVRRAPRIAKKRVFAGRGGTTRRGANENENASSSGITTERQFSFRSVGGIARAARACVASSVRVSPSSRGEDGRKSVVLMS